jgi:hypothetical protein
MVNNAVFADLVSARFVRFKTMRSSSVAPTTTLSAGCPPRTVSLIFDVAGRRSTRVHDVFRGVWSATAEQGRSRTAAKTSAALDFIATLRAYMCEATAQGLTRSSDAARSDVRA